MEWDPYLLDPMMSEDLQNSTSNDDVPSVEVESQPTPEIPVQRQTLSAENWCKCGACEARLTHQECLYCQENRNTSQRVANGQCVTSHMDFQPLFLFPATLRQFVSCIHEIRGYGRQHGAEAEWMNRYDNRQGLFSSLVSHQAVSRFWGGINNHSYKQ